MALARNIASGVAVAGLLIAEAVAYSSIAGLAPVEALIAAVIGLTVYSAFGRSRFAITSPTSSSAAVLAAGLATLGATDPALRSTMAATIVGLAGALYLVMGVMRLGSLASFVSRPVLRGFAFGLAINIVVRQLPAVAGVQDNATNTFLVLVGLLGSVAAWNWPSIAVGSLALGLLFGMRRWPRLPGAFIVLAGFVVATFVMDFPAHHVALVGPVTLSLRWPALPQFDIHVWWAMANVAMPVALIVFAESWGTIRTLALRHGDDVSPNRELLALGAANLLSGALGGMAAGAGFSGSSANEAAGATNRLSGLVAAVAVTMLLTGAGNLIARTPEPVFAAIVMAALSHTLDPSPLLRLWRIDRDQIIATAAVIGVLAFGVLNGMLLAVLLSVLALVRRIATPAISTLGRLGDSNDFVDLTRHPEAATVPGILIVRPSEPMFFANAEAIMTAIERQAVAAKSGSVILSLEHSDDLDSTALDALSDSANRLAKHQCQLVLAHMKDPVRDLLMTTGGTQVALALHGTRTVAEAVSAIIISPGKDA
jgi:MFS superfamily sulfate permease-like transporter